LCWLFSEETWEDPEEFSYPDEEADEGDAEQAGDDED